MEQKWQAKRSAKETLKVATAAASVPVAAKATGRENHVPVSSERAEQEEMDSTHREQADVRESLGHAAVQHLMSKFQEVEISRISASSLRCHPYPVYLQIQRRLAELEETVRLLKSSGSGGSRGSVSGSESNSGSGGGSKESGGTAANAVAEAAVAVEAVVEAAKK